MAEARAAAAAAPADDATAEAPDGGSAARKPRKRATTRDAIDWDAISQRMGGTRDPKQCFNKWYNKLAPNMTDTSEWGRGEDMVLLKALWAAKPGYVRTALLLPFCVRSCACAPATALARLLASQASQALCALARFLMLAQVRPIAEFFATWKLLLQSCLHAYARVHAHELCGAACSSSK